MENEIKLGHYPFKSNEENRNLIYLEMGRQLTTLLEDPIFIRLDKNEIYDYISAHIIRAEKAFDMEEENRKKGKPNANLHYHGKDHAVFQATYDAIAASRAILSKNGKVA